MFVANTSHSTETLVEGNNGDTNDVLQCDIPVIWNLSKLWDKSSELVERTPLPLESALTGKILIYKTII